MYSVLLVAVLILQCTEGEDADSGAIGKLTELQDALKKEFGEDNPRVKGLVTVLETTKTDLGKNSASSSLDRDSVSDAVNGVVKALPKFKSSNPIDVATGVTDAIASAAVLVPGPWGVAVSTVFSVIGGLIGMAKNTPTMAQVVEGIIKKQLTVQRQNELADEVSGAKRELDSLHSMLAAASNGKQPTEMDIMYINSQAGNQIGLRILGILESYITRESHNVNSRGAFSSHFNLIKLYVELSNIRSSLLHMMHSLYHQSNLTRTTEDGIMDAIRSTLKIDGDLFKFYENPAPDQAFLVASTWPSSYPGVAAYFKKAGVNLNKHQDELIAKTCGYYIYSKKWPNYYIFNQGGKNPVSLTAWDQTGGWSTWKPSDRKGQGAFVFKKSGVFVTMTTKAAPSNGKIRNSLFHRTRHISYYEGSSGATQFRVVKMSDGNYYWDQRDWGKPVMMEDSFANPASEPYPGDQVYWTFKSAC